MEEIVYLNGSLLPRSQARISPFDQGFLYGYGLFETMRAYHGSIFLLEHHIQRLLAGAEVIGIASGLEKDELIRACIDTVKANNLRDSRIRLTVSRGEVATFPGTNCKINPTVLVTASSYQPPADRVYKNGFRAGISSFQRSSQSLLPRLKSANYLVNILTKLEAESSGLDEALLLNERGFITEGSISNVFFAKANKLVTPSLESGILPGITRQVVMELAGEIGIAVGEGDVGLSDLAGFDEAFLTNSIMEIMPLVLFRNKLGEEMAIGSGKPGAITSQLMAEYRNMVEKEIEKGL